MVPLGCRALCSLKAQENCARCREKLFVCWPTIFLHHLHRLSPPMPPCPQGHYVVRRAAYGSLQCQFFEEGGEWQAMMKVTKDWILVPLEDQEIVVFSGQYGWYCTVYEIREDS